MNGTATPSSTPCTASTPFRIALATETFPPEVNGVALTIARLVDGLRRAGHSVRVIRPRQPSDPRPPSPCPDADVLAPGAPIPFYPQLRFGLPVFARLRRLWKAKRPDVVHVVTEGPLGLSALAAARSLGIPVCSEFRTNFHAYSAHYGAAWLSGAVLAYLRWFHNRTEITVAPTRRLARQLETAGFDRLSVVARGIDTRLFSPDLRCNALRASWGASPESLVALYVGRLAHEKNLPVLISAFQNLRRRHPDARLVLVGDGPARDSIARACPDAILAGVQKGACLARHYASADVFLFSSLTETFGNVTLEAMASGLAVLAFDHAAAGELINPGVNGLLAAPGDNPQFIRMLAELAADPQQILRLKSAARASVLGMDWSRIIDQLAHVYQGLIERSQTTAASSPRPTARKPVGSDEPLPS